MDLTKVEKALLKYLLNNEKDNIISREEIDSFDKSALKVADKILERLKGENKCMKII
jgi:hypothetical protein